MKLPENFDKVCYGYKNGEINQTEAAKLSNMSRATFKKKYKNFCIKEVRNE